VSRQTLPGDALSGALELADQLAAGPTSAYAQTKALISDGFGRSFTETLRRERLAQARLGTTADHQGAVKAFLSKEGPTYTGA
jgi:2-(1,2-epoxy-1,2-dihydrophenyl)acetyl-CoA isomerase